MTERRANDLSYGHLGEATYDIETGEWRFLLDPFAQTIQELIPLRSGIPASTKPALLTTGLAKDRTISVVKSRPEIFPARPILKSWAQIEPPTRSSTQVGQLLAVGSAVNAEQTFGSRKTTVIATSSGRAGHVLRLIRPRLRRHEWGKQSSVRLSSLDIEPQDQGHWIGVGGKILQLAFAEERNVPTTYLAVRQANATTIFRPLYGETPTPTLVPSGYTNSYDPSRLSANPIGVVTAEQTRSGSHADVTFNPWYSRQFAVVDASGSWTIWDIEGRLKKLNTPRLIPGRKANIYDDNFSDRTLNPPDNADGWHKILWVGSVSTIVVCNRRHLVVFDVKTAPNRLPSRAFFAASNSDWILDVNRSPLDLRHMFVLTSSRIFWLAVIPGGEEKKGEAGYKVIISCRHFRDANDSTMRLSVLNRAHEVKTTADLSRVCIAISSMASSLVNLYIFSNNSDGLEPTLCQGSMLLSKDLDDQEMGIDQRLHSLYFLETPLKAISNRPPSLQTQYIEQDIKFFQVLTVSPSLGLSAGLWSMQFISQNSRSEPLQVTAPTRTYIHSSGYMTTRRVVDGPWIIPDGQYDDEHEAQSGGPSYYNNRLVSRMGRDEDSRLTINFKSIYQQAFNDISSSDSSLTVFLENIQARIRQRKETDELSMSTLLGLSQLSGFTEDLEQAAPILREFLDSIKADEEPASTSILVLCNLTQCPGISFEDFEVSMLPNLLKIYDQVAERWISNLPLQVSGLTRLAKFRIARKVAVELYLSSIGISTRNQSAILPSIVPPSAGEESLALGSTSAISQAESLTQFSSQIPPSLFNKPMFGYPTPSQTPSLYAQSHTSASEHAEDPAITRLRQYATSMKAKSDLGTSRILPHWPETTGVDPAIYSWEELQKKAVTDGSGDESDHNKRREVARRKRRTEKFLSRESTAVTEAYSQPSIAPFGSQLDIAQYPASSQTIVDDNSMTQPGKGAFGIRSLPQGKKKQKKKRAAGFR